jgi:hypothetical protein
MKFNHLTGRGYWRVNVGWNPVHEIERRNQGDQGSLPQRLVTLLALLDLFLQHHLLRDYINHFVNIHMRKHRSLVMSGQISNTTFNEHVGYLLIDVGNGTSSDLFFAHVSDPNDFATVTQLTGAFTAC